MDPLRIRGYAALFDSASVGLPFIETIARGAFDRVLREVRAGKQDVLALAEHDTRLLLGRTRSKSLTLSVTHEGLRYEVDLPDTTIARDVHAQIDAGNIFQSSFGFTVSPEGERWSIGVDDVLHRRIVEVERLHDVSPVAQAAYPETTVSVRTADEGDDDELPAWRAQLEIDTLRLQLEADEPIPLAGQWEIDRLRYTLGEGEAMGEARCKHSDCAVNFERAALAVRGVKVDHDVTLRRGLVQIGRRLLVEVEAGRGRRTLTPTETRCLEAALEDAEADTERRVRAAIKG